MESTISSRDASEIGIVIRFRPCTTCNARSQTSQADFTELSSSIVTHVMSGVGIWPPERGSVATIRMGGWENDHLSIACADLRLCCNLSRLFVHRNLPAENDSTVCCANSEFGHNRIRLPVNVLTVTGIASRRVGREEGSVKQAIYSHLQPFGALRIPAIRNMNYSMD